MDLAFEPGGAGAERVPEMGVEQGFAFRMAEKVRDWNAAIVAREIFFRFAKPFLHEAVADEEFHLIAQNEDGVVRTVKIASQQIEITLFILGLRHSEHHQFSYCACVRP